MSNPIVVDLSHWNSTPDWMALARNGTIGVIHKATEGTSYVDDELFSRARDAMEAGLCWATYHFLRGDSSPEQQMEHYLETVNPRQGERMCIDHEEQASLDDLKRAVSHLLSLRPDVQVTIYSGHLIKEQLGSEHDDFLAATTSLWIAHYTSASTPTWPVGTWPNWSLWQYTDKASAIGTTEKVDGNRWNGSEEALRAWFGPAEDVPVPEPEPEPVPEPWLIAITTPAGTGSVTVNGQVVWEQYEGV